MGEWCINICVLQTIFYNITCYGVTLIKHICHNADASTKVRALQLYHTEMFTFVRCCIPITVYDIIGIYRLQNIWSYWSLYRACDHCHSRETVGWSLSRVSTNHNLDAICIIVESVWHEANTNYKKQVIGTHIGSQWVMERDVFTLCIAIVPYGSNHQWISVLFSYNVFAVWYLIFRETSPHTAHGATIHGRPKHETVDCLWLPVSTSHNSDPNSAQVWTYCGIFQLLTRLKNWTGMHWRAVNSGKKAELTKTCPLDTCCHAML